MLLSAMVEGQGTILRRDAMHNEPQSHPTQPNTGNNVNTHLKKNKLAKLGDVIAISNMKLSITD